MSHACRSCFPWNLVELVHLTYSHAYQSTGKQILKRPTFLVETLVGLFVNWFTSKFTETANSRLQYNGVSALLINYILPPFLCIYFCWQFLVIFLPLAREIWGRSEKCQNRMALISSFRILFINLPKAQNALDFHYKQYISVSPMINEIRFPL